MKFHVEGMTCSHCERAISNAVARLGGHAQVDLAAGTVVVDGVSDEAAARAVIEEEGYRVTGPANERTVTVGGTGCCGSCHT